MVVAMVYVPAWIVPTGKTPGLTSTHVSDRIGAALGSEWLKCGRE